MKVIKKAYELANAIQECDELLRVRELEAKLLNQDKIEENSPIYQEYLAAVQQFTNLLNAVRYILTSSYDGKLSLHDGCFRCCKR